MTNTIYFGETLGAQGRALALAANLAEQHPKLPPAYLTCSSHEPNKLTALVEYPEQFEAWREALHVAPEDVYHGTLGSKRTLFFDAAVDRVTLHVWVSFLSAESETEGGIS